MRSSTIALSIAVSFELAGILHAQTEDIQFENLSVEHGLSHPSVGPILQDHSGFMWFGTSDGLNRFDGHKFIVYKHNPKDSNSLSSSFILCLLEDTDGILWIGTGGGGLNSFDHETGTFKRHTLGTGSRTNQYISSLYEGRSGILWIGADSLIGLDRKSGRRIQPNDRMSAGPSLGVKRPQSIYEDSSGTLWVGTWFDGVRRIEQHRNGITVYRHDPGSSSSLSEDHVISIHRDSQGHLWFGTYAGGLNRFDCETEKFTRYTKSDRTPDGLNDNTICSIYEDREGRLWLGTSRGGVNILDRKTGKISHLMHERSKATSLSDDHVSAICEDRSGVLWLGTDKGVSRYVRPKNRFSFIPAGSDFGAFPDPVGSLCEDRYGVLWIGHHTKGLTRFVREQKHFTHYEHDRRNSDGFLGAYITDVFADHLGCVWAGTTGRNVVRFDPRTGSFKTYRIEGSDLAENGNSADAFLEDQRGVLWLGTGRGIARFNRTKDTFTYYGDYASGPGRDPSVSHVQCMLDDKDSIVWVGTRYSGLIEFHTGRGILSHHEHISSDSNSIGTNDITVLYRDRIGRLWIGTRGGGLDRYNRITGAFSHLTEEDGLVSNVIQGLLEDDKMNLWISTPRGLSRFNPESGTIRNYDAADGLAGLAGGSFVKSRTGEMIAASDLGLFIFHPDSVRDNTHVPNVVLTAFNVLNEPYPLPQPIHNTKDILLDYTQNFFSFEFAALDYVVPQKNRYAYRLEGVDDDWIQAGTRRYANYTHISPGKYVFHVKGSNNDGVWNEVGTSVSLVIAPPFWQASWFRAMVLLTVVGLLALGYNYRVNKLLELERVRVRIARDLHDELGSNLSGIALASRMVQEGPNLTDEQRQQLTEISDNALQTADTMREIIWFINPEHDGPRDLVLKMKDVASSMLGKVDLRFDADDDVFGYSPNLEFRRNLFLIYKEILNNIAKHANCSGVEILLERDGPALRLSVTDNGDGFDTQSTPRGNGLKNLSARATAMGGTIDIVSHPGEGTGIFLQAKMA